MQHASSLLVIHTLNCHWTLAFIASMAPFILSCIGVVIVTAEKEKRWIKKLSWCFEFHSQQRQKWTKGCILDFCKMRNDSNFFTMQLHFFCSSYLQRVAQCRRVFLVCDCVIVCISPPFLNELILSSITSAEPLCIFLFPKLSACLCLIVCSLWAMSLSLTYLTCTLKSCSDGRKRQRDREVERGGKVGERTEMEGGREGWGENQRPADVH